MRFNNRTSLSIAALIFTVLLPACRRSQDVPAVTSTTTSSSVDQTPHHEHHAPHGGILVELGAEIGHVELVWDANTGGITAYVLDGEAEAAVRITQKEIVLELSGGEGKLSTVTLVAVSNYLTGEKSGDTSEFRGKVNGPRPSSSLKGSIRTVSFKGQTFSNVAF